MVDKLRAKQEACRIRIKELEAEINKELAKYNIYDELIVEFEEEAKAVEEVVEETTNEINVGV